MIFDAFRTRILQKQTLASLLGNRFYPLAAPQDTAVPYLVYGRVGEEGTPSHDGGSGGLCRTTFRLSVWAENYMEADSIGDEIRLLMDGYAGAAGSGTIKSCFKSDARDRYAPPQSGEELGLFGREIDYRVRYVEVAPTNT